jgi:hypothetical protein
MPSVTYNPFMLNDIMPSVTYKSFTLSDIMLNVVMLIVVAPLFTSDDKRSKHQFIVSSARWQHGSYLCNQLLVSKHRYQKTKNRLLKVSYVTATSARLPRLLFTNEANKAGGMHH